MILSSIRRHPIKAHGREDLASVLLSTGALLPGDCHWTVAHEAAKLAKGWGRCANVWRGTNAPAPMAITANPETGILDADTLAALQSHHGHRDFGVYATVIRGGKITRRDEVRPC